MARSSSISISVYKSNLRLYKFLNDYWIFIELTRPALKDQADKLQKSKSKKKRTYPVPKKTGFVKSRRLDSDVGFIMNYQYSTGVFENSIISIVSRIEVYIQECVQLAVRQYPEKLAVLAGEKASIPISMFVSSLDKDQILSDYTSQKCSDLMFLKPSDYIARLEKVLSIKLSPDIVAKFIEMKATRDLIVHNRREINEIYIEKAGAEARGQIGTLLPIDNSYFRSVIVNAKMLSGSIQSAIEAKYG